MRTEKIEKNTKSQSSFPPDLGEFSKYGGIFWNFSPPDLGEFTFLISKILPWGIPVSSVPPDCLQLFSADPNENLDNLTQKRGLPFHQDQSDFESFQL